MSESLLTAVHAAAQPTQPAAAPPEQAPAPAPAPAPTPAPAAASADANAVRADAASLAELYGLAHPANAAAFNALAVDIRSDRSQADVSRALLEAKTPSPAAAISHHRPDNSINKPGETTQAEMPSLAYVYSGMNGQTKAKA